MKSRKRKKKLVFMIAIIIVVFTLVIILSTIKPPSPYLEVHYVIDHTPKYNSTKIEVVGTVGEISSLNNSSGLKFELIDRKYDTKLIWVEAVSQPEGFVTGKDVVVTGTLVNRNGQYIIEAKNIKVGCSSKYE